MKFFIMFVVALSSNAFSAIAQHEADNWYFGYYSGISFQNNSVIKAEGGQTRTVEGCASISDRYTGDLLFYTDGISVWNGKHQIVKNGKGLKGGGSSTQGALIIPNPANRIEYYIFTVAEEASKSLDLSYSVISFENDSGEIISKNNVILTSASEKLTGTIDCDGSGFWVVAHHTSKSIIYSYHIDKLGVNITPVISPYISDKSYFVRGYMKISPNREKLILTSTIYGGYLALFNFDAKSGKISNQMNIIDGEDTISVLGPYGVTFSPDNSKCYVTNYSNTIYQYEVNLPDATSIRNSKYILNGNYKYNAALQIGPNGKIYVAQGNESGSLGVISYPNLKGNACNYLANVVSLSGECHSGLPNFMDYIFNSTGPVYGPQIPCAPPIATAISDSDCVGSRLVFKDISKYAKRRFWSFPSGTPSTSTDSIVSVTYSKAGTYKVRLVAENDNGSDTTYTEAIIFPLPTANAGEDKNICQNEKIQLGDKPEVVNTYSWLPITDLDNPSIANPNASPKSTTQYILTVTSEHGCIAYDTVLVTVGNIVAKVSNDTTICSGSSVQLLASGGAKYTWTPSTGLSDSTIENPIATPTKKPPTKYSSPAAHAKIPHSSPSRSIHNPPPTPDKTKPSASAQAQK
ncbi:MAG: PKD domain-containing protein [Ignavibacteria bacterium]|nr:PKD domain-containing protein [Ignavibacteria bacterium]